MALRSDKKIVVIVGVTGEMGRQFAQSLIEDSYTVVGVARNKEALTRLATKLSASQLFVPCAASISQDDAIASIEQHIDAPVHAVVHAPGVPTAGGVLEAGTDALQEAMNIKVCGMLRLVRAVERFLQKNSRLIGIGGHYGFEPTAYAATAGVANAALANLIRQLSWAYGERKITAHLIAPGPADTPRLNRIAQTRAEREKTTREQILAQMTNQSALHEFTKIEDVVWAVKMLLSPHANALAGSTLFMDAGRRHGLP